MSYGYETLNGGLALEDLDDFEDLDDLFSEDDDSDDDYVFAEDDGESDDERRSRRRGRKPRRVHVRTATRRGGYTPPQRSKRAATRSDLSASLAKVGADIRRNAAAIKSLAGQVNKVTRDFGGVNRTQEGAITALRKQISRNTQADASRAQMSMLLPLLQKKAELEPKPNLSTVQSDFATDVLNSVQVKKADDTMTLALMMMTMGQSDAGAGGSSASSMNMMLPLVLLMSK
ncbi:MAG TPA: hypothetical protein VJP77_00350 [Planctomycetota bacterium]|nr:hypothetical protein [Planctomycetota bacterium]